MTIKNKQTTIKVPIDLDTQIINNAWKERISCNKVIKNILLKAFNLLEELPPVMTNIIWDKLNSLESKLDKLYTRQI